jgi:hypothetical protein
MFALNTSPAREIESRYPTVPPGGVPEWYGLYRRIPDTSKSVRAVGVQPNEILPLLDALGGQGTYIITSFRDWAEAEALRARVEPNH